MGLFGALGSIAGSFLGGPTGGVYRDWETSQSQSKVKVNKSQKSKKVKV